MLPRMRGCVETGPKHIMLAKQGDVKECETFHAGVPNQKQVVKRNLAAVLATSTGRE